jgi:hypothetical protein
MGALETGQRAAFATSDKLLEVGFDARAPLQRSRLGSCVHWALLACCASLQLRTASATSDRELESKRNFNFL